MSFLRAALGRFSRDMGIDLGTANTLVHVRGRGIVLREPSVMVIDQETGRPLAVGADAKRMLGRTPDSIAAVRPLKDGVIADFELTEQMIRHFIAQVHRRTVLLAPRVVVGVPTGVTEVEERAVKDAVLRAGAAEAYLVDEPMAAAIGARLPVFEPIGTMIVDIGGGTTEVAVISMGEVVISHSIRVAGDEIDEAVAEHVRREYNLYIGARSAEDTKLSVGSAFPVSEERTAEVRGRDLVTGLPRSADVSSAEIRQAIREPVTAIVDTVRRTLEGTPPELSADIYERGLVLAGGGALLEGMDQLLCRETSMPVHVAPDPLACVALGAGRLLEGMDGSAALRRLLRG